MFDIFYIGNQPTNIPYAQSVKSKEEAQQQSKTRYCWLINTYTDYTTWDFLWEPTPWEKQYTHAFPSQWQRDSGTYLLSKTSQDINYRTDRAIVRTQPSAEVVLIDHLDNNVDLATKEISKRATVAKTTKFVDNYLETLIRIAKNAKTEYLWICSSVCNYANFDFTWHPDPWQKEMLHIFPSNFQKFGDTFYLHVSSFLKDAPNCQLLDWYNNNFSKDQTVPRYTIPKVMHTEDTHVGQLPDSQQEPLVLYANEKVWLKTIPTVPLWRRETRAITPIDSRGTGVIVPRDALGLVKTQLWDYDIVDRSYQQEPSEPLDIVFIENGEVNAEENYKHLKDCVLQKPNKVKRVSNVKGRVAAYQAAAKVSSTPWFFAVFAKLTVDENFDWDWQPDCLQQPKHYIFHARNPINGLEYGHMAMIAYNKKLVLSNNGPGLDFTLDQAHEVVPQLSGIANYADDEFMAWRSAFREVIKLKHAVEQQPDVETEYRLRQWLTCGEGIKGKWSIEGAKDAVEYYSEVKGNFDQLKLSYDWEWLNQRFDLLHAE